jgi:hypothetical protein
VKILFTNNTLAGRYGTELWLRDMIPAIRCHGHEVAAFSTVLGEVAVELRELGVPVINSLESLPFVPDVIHGQHHLETMMALTRFPGVPAVFVCHGWLVWEETPPKHPRIVRHVAVDELCRERLITEAGLPASRTDVVLNFVDLRRFPQRPPLPPRPTRALLFSHYVKEPEQLGTLRRACQSWGLELDHLGESSGEVSAAPGEALRTYDLVFAKARSALEALATGAAVILFGPEGCGPLVTRENLLSLRRMNFGVSALSSPVTEERLLEEMGAYDPADARRVSQWVRREGDLTVAAERFHQIYVDIGTQATVVQEHEERMAVSAYLGSLAGPLKAHGLVQDPEQLSQRLVGCGRELAFLRRQLHEVTQTRTWRAREGLLRWPLVVRLHRLLLGRSGQLGRR